MASGLWNRAVIPIELTINQCQCPLWHTTITVWGYMQEGFLTSVARCGPLTQQCNPTHHMSGTRVVAFISLETSEHPLYNLDLAVRLWPICPTKETLQRSLILQYWGRKWLHILASSFYCNRLFILRPKWGTHINVLIKCTCRLCWKIILQWNKYIIHIAMVLHLIQ
jgi:hypothetical protein